jgi:hypothetical protein
MEMQKVINPTEWSLTAADRCDVCDAQAYIKVEGVTGQLLFCAHHYNKIMDNPKGYEKMMAFMFRVTDETERLNENRSQGDN